MGYPPLSDMAGQLFLAGFKGAAVPPDHPVYEDIARRNLGGVILFDRHLSSQSATNNITGRDQLLQLTGQLQSVRQEKLLIAVDQEGGKVNRFRKEFGFPLFKEAAALGKSDNKEITEAADQLSRMLKDCGVNWNLAPVLDLNTNPDNPIIGRVGRSFAENPATVSEKSGAWVAAHEQNNILTCLKHFPGHGSSVNDSHLGFVDISATWHRDELLPFKHLIDRDMARSIMLGHLFHKGFDEELPTSLSAQTVSYLRHGMNFNGAIVTDDMQMRAITDRFGLSEACIMALRAGVDIVILGNNLSYDPDLFRKIHQDVLNAVQGGQLDRARIEQSWERVQNLKSFIRW